VLHRSRADWPVVLASWLLLVCALGLLSAGTLYTDAVTDAGLRRELAAAPAPDRAVVVRTQILPEQLEAADAAIAPELERVLAMTGGRLVRVLRSSPFADPAADPETVRELVLFASLEGIRDHAAVVDGRWPEAGRTPVEVAVSVPAARLLGVGVGDRVPLVGRLDGRTVEAVVMGTWRADPADPYWLGEPLLLGGAETGDSFSILGPLVVDAADLAGPIAGGRQVDARWLAIPDLGGFTPDNLDQVAGAASGLLGIINAALPASNKATVATRLPAVLDAVDRSVLVAQSGILLLLIQFGVLAGYAVILVAALLTDRRRTETALLRARGAGLGHLVRMASAEALLIVVPAVLAAPWVATLLVAAVGLSPSLAGVGLTAPLPDAATFGVAAVTGLLAFAALVLPTLAGGVSIAGARALAGRQVGRTLPQRLGLDLALVLLAAIALLQLRLYGAPITRNARGTLGVDPLLVAAPAIGLLAGAVIAVRLVPRLAELAERALSRGRGLVAALGSRQLARRPLRYTRAALLLVLAAALGTFASAHAATWTRSQADQATFVSGADVRLEPGARSDLPGWALGEALRGIAGTTAATPIVVAQASLGSELRDATLLGVDGPALADIVRLGDAGDGEATREALRSLAAGRPTAPGLEVPEGTRRLSVLVDSAFTTVDGFEPVPPGYEGLGVAVVVVDGDGRIARLEGTPAALDVDGARSVVALTVPGTAGVTEPVHVLALELELGLGALTNTMATGEILVRALGTSPDEDGDAWADVPMADVSPVAWTADTGGGPVPYEPAPPGRLVVEMAAPYATAAWEARFSEEAAPVLPVLANAAFLERSGARVGETLRATVFGLPVELRLLGAVDGFPTQPAGDPLLVADGPSLDLARFAGGVTLAGTDEWWIATAPGASTGVAAAAAAPPIGARVIADRAVLEADLVADPLGLGVIGILGLGSVAALVFAAIGYLVTTTVSTQERLGEFALLKAVGLSPRQLFTWLTLEGTSLLAVGLVAGVGLGLVLAWLALPFATLTASGEPPVPAPAVVVPVDALVPIVALAAALVAATMLIVRRLLPSARTSAVLRAKDE
jgi:hypothetical protein